MCDDLARRLESDDERRPFATPELVRRMIAAGLLGVKTGAGFYKRVTPDGKSDILTLDVKKVEAGTYVAVPARRTSAGLDALASIADLETRLRTLFRSKDRAARSSAARSARH